MEHDLASGIGIGEGCSPDEAWEILWPALLESGEWDKTSPGPRSRVDIELMELVESLGPDPGNGYDEPMLRGHNEETSGEALNLAERLELRGGFKFTAIEGGDGGTPYFQCILMARVC
jgi:hypothetical protein